LVNWIVIFPAFAVSELLVNLSWPLGSAEIARAPFACPGELAGAVELWAEADELWAGPLEAGDDVALLWLDPPQAATPIAPMTIVRAVAVFGMLRALLSA
jgi:hypothetical protein